MKTLWIATLSLISVTAFAAGTERPLLTYTSENGTVAPKYKTSHVCEISATKVTITNYVGMTDSKKISNQDAQFTNDVPNAIVLKSLMLDAAHAPSKAMAHPPIGGSMISYVADMSTDKSVTLLQKAGGAVTIMENKSEAAQRLVKFMDENCNN